MDGHFSFSVEGINDRVSFTIPIAEESTILVGPNGSGKSTAISILYLAISKQWRRLIDDFTFRSLEIRFGSQTVSLTYSQIENFLQSRETFRPVPIRVITALQEDGTIDEFISASRLSSDQVLYYSKLLRIPSRNVERIRQDIKQNSLPFDEDIEAERRFSQAIQERILFLPTYRRIEQDLKKINQEAYESFTRYRETAPVFARRRENFQEIIEFGMKDVEEIWKLACDDVREFSRTTFNTLSSDYLRSVISGKPTESFPRDLTSDRVREILSRSTLTGTDTDDIFRRVTQLNNESLNQTADGFLAKYFTLLVKAVGQIEGKEYPLKSLAELLTLYLGSRKRVIYDPVECKIQILQGEKAIKLSSLSSGEKQVVSTFTYLYLQDGPPYTVIIDEPELSLSVIWQERFLVDIVRAPKFKRLIAVTHSPFVYDNELLSSVVDFGACCTDGETDAD